MILREVVDLCVSVPLWQVPVCVSRVHVSSPCLAVAAERSLPRLSGHQWECFQHVLELLDGQLIQTGGEDLQRRERTIAMSAFELSGKRGDGAKGAGALMTSGHRQAF